jgi:epoxyqueuosine reductase
VVVYSKCRRHETVRFTFFRELVAPAQMEPMTRVHSPASPDAELAVGVHRLLPQGQPLAFGEWPAAIQRHAVELGWHRLGITSVEPLTDANAALRSWITQGYQGQMEYMTQPRSHPLHLLPTARSLIVGALAYAGAVTPGQAIASYARGADYHHVLKVKLLALAQSITNDLGRPVLARACVDTAPLLERAVAERAGIGFTGKSTLTIVPGAGTYVLLGELLLDVELPTTSGADSGCGRCTRCLDACPTQAFVGPYVLDARRCISYLTIEHRGVIPLELRAGIGTHVVGCDICQIVCPFNASKKPRVKSAELAPSAAQPDLVELLQLTSSGYRRLTKRSALGRVSRAQLQRNAAVALGNSTHPDAVPALIQALDHANPLVRSHVAWALGRKRDQAPEVGPALERALAVETDAAVAAELRSALGAGTVLP